MSAPPPGRRRPSDPDEATCHLAWRIYTAGRHHCGIPPEDCQFPETKYTDPDSLADVVIDMGCRDVQAEDMRRHGNRLAKGSPGSQAQSVIERLHHDPEPRVAQLVRQRVHADWMHNDESLNKLADRVLQIGLAGEGEATAAAQEDPEAMARLILDRARRQLAAAEGNQHMPGGEVAQVEAAFDTFDPPIRRHALADILLRRLQTRRGSAGRAKAAPLAPQGTTAAEV